MISIPNWISYLHANFWIFSPPLAILFNFLKSKTYLDFPKFTIQNPFWIWRIFYKESCSAHQIFQNNILFQNFQSWECHFWNESILKHLKRKFKINFNPRGPTRYPLPASVSWAPPRVSPPRPPPLHSPFLFTQPEPPPPLVPGSTTPLGPRRDLLPPRPGRGRTARTPHPPPPP
jgi:hypothetical protein